MPQILTNFFYEAGILFCSIKKGGKGLIGQNTFFVLENIRPICWQS